MTKTSYLRYQWHAGYALFLKEWRSYFSTLLGSLFLFFFAIILGALPIYIGNFIARDQASLNALFESVPWVFLIFIPAITMRLWSEERNTGTIEILMTLPIAPITSVLAKFFSAWAFAGLGLILTFPFWITINILGDPDNAVALGGYIAAFILAGSLIAVGGFFSSLTKNQITAFITTTGMCFLLIVSGSRGVLSVFQDWAPEILLRFIAELSLLNHFLDMQRGLFSIQSLVYLFSLMGLFLFLNAAILDKVKAQ